MASHKKRYSASLKIGFLLIVIACAIFYSFGIHKPVLLTSIDNKIMDIMFKIRGTRPTTGNIVIVQDQTVIIPESSHRLMGIMENTVCNNYVQKGYSIVRQKIYQDKLILEIKGTFVTNSLIGKVPVTSIDSYLSN